MIATVFGLCQSKPYIEGRRGGIAIRPTSPHHVDQMPTTVHRYQIAIPPQSSAATVSRRSPNHGSATNRTSSRYRAPSRMA